MKDQPMQDHALIQRGSEWCQAAGCEQRATPYGGLRPLCATHAEAERAQVRRRVLADRRQAHTDGGLRRDVRRDPAPWCGGREVYARFTGATVTARRTGQEVAVVHNVLPGERAEVARSLAATWPADAYTIVWREEG